MDIAGSISPPGGAPKPDPERVATLRYTIVDEPETCAAFGEDVRAALASLNDRALAETRSGDLGECLLLLDQVRGSVAGLDPVRLEPRGGLAGLFDSRGKRLKAFRAAWDSTAAAVARSASDLGDRAGALARKSTALETLWSETRDAIAELDAHIAAARIWLDNQTPAPAAAESAAPSAEVETPQPTEEVHEQVEAQADDETPVSSVEDRTEPGQVETVDDRVEIAPTGEARATDPILPPDAEDAPVAEGLIAAVEPLEDAPAEAGVVAEASAEPEVKVAPEASAAPEAGLQTEPAPPPAPVASLPHPLETRLIALEALRATAIGRLPLLRAAQNADCRAPAVLKQVCDGVEAWRADWQDALGLEGKRPKKVRPDPVRLSNASSALTGSISAAGHELSAAQSRRAELDARTAPAPGAALAA